jgi:hypothetical protein
MAVAHPAGTDFLTIKIRIYTRFMQLHTNIKVFKVDMGVVTIGSFLRSMLLQFAANAAFGFVLTDISCADLVTP